MEADRIKGALQRLVQSFMARIDYLALYPARVVSMEVSGQTVELKPDDARIPDLTDVPLWHGLPGVEVEVEKDARVLLGFEGGNPARPFAMLWQGETLKSLKVTSVGEVSVEAQGDVEVKGVNVKVEATGKAEVQGNTVAIDAKTPLGSIAIGGANLGVARQSDPVQAGPFAGTITMGSLKVMAG